MWCYAGSAFAIDFNSIVLEQSNHHAKYTPVSSANDIVRHFRAEEIQVLTMFSNPNNNKASNNRVEGMGNPLRVPLNPHP
jgi:hypothetical protein